MAKTACWRSLALYYHGLSTGKTSLSEIDSHTLFHFPNDVFIDVCVAFCFRNARFVYYYYYRDFRECVDQTSELLLRLCVVITISNSKYSRPCFCSNFSRIPSICVQGKFIERAGRFREWQINNMLRRTSRAHLLYFYNKYRIGLRHFIHNELMPQ